MRLSLRGRRRVFEELMMGDEFEVVFHTKKPIYCGKIVVISATDECEARRIARKVLRKRFKYEGLVIDYVSLFKQRK